MFLTIKRKFFRLIYLYMNRFVYFLPSIEYKVSNGVAIISQLQRKDILLYLIAVRSFVYHVKVDKIIVINDGSLTSRDICNLKKHIVDIEIRNIEEFERKTCPRGGTWERLIAISEYVKEYYVIQLDSDTLVLSSIDDVKDFIQNKIAFTLGTIEGKEIERMEDRGKISNKMSDNKHVQIVAENNFCALSEYSSLKYIRGCSGFAGFPKKSFKYVFIEKIAVEMYESIGSKWEEWGSEQVMSNIVIANITDSRILNFPRYVASNHINDESVFIHFIGNYRFNNNKYAKIARNIIKSNLQ